MSLAESNSLTRTPLPLSFYARDTHAVAREVLGKLLVRRWRGQDLVGRITEVESYVGEDDLACHASKGRTARTEVLFGPPGRAYVYLIYGMYDLLNFVTETDGFPAAVLIRSLEPIAGVDAMRRARRVENLRHLTTGPGKLTQALRIDRRCNRVDLTLGQRLLVVDDGFRADPANIATSPRIGVDYAGAHAQLPWRYYLADSSFVSRRS